MSPYHRRHACDLSSCFSFVVFFLVWMSLHHYHYILVLKMNQLNLTTLQYSPTLQTHPFRTYSLWPGSDTSVDELGHAPSSWGKTEVFTSFCSVHCHGTWQRRGVSHGHVHFGGLGWSVRRLLLHFLYPTMPLRCVGLPVDMAVLNSASASMSRQPPVAERPRGTHGSVLPKYPRIKDLQSLTQKGDLLLSLTFLPVCLSPCRSVFL